MKLALEEARKSTAETSQRFRVGSLIVGDDVLSTGYTGELPGNTHAEECALEKLRGRDVAFHDCDIYTTMQPCTKRLSGLRTCSERVIEAGLRRCFIGTYEPSDFVAAESVQALEDGGVEVIHVASLSAECLDVARGIVTR